MKLSKILRGYLLFFTPIFAQSQTFTDGILMPKKSICAGVMFTQDAFKDYWEGTTKRDNLNMGTMTFQGVGVMANYGILDNLNVIAMLPYVTTKASAGVLSGWSGVQDLTFGLKYNVLKKDNLDVIATVGGSVPMTNYLAANPLAIGNQSKTLFGRAILHYLNQNGMTVTAQGAYILRGNIKIDATNYYTDRNINSNEVAMGDQFNASIRAGYYTFRSAFEGVFEQNTTLDGFDIRRNDMPFPSNKMEATRVGVMAHYRIEKLKDLQVVANVFYTINGRNVGQALSTNLGLFMAFDFKKKEVSR